MTWVERSHSRPDYTRINYVWRQHHQRYVRHVEVDGLTCQSCRGYGGWTDVIVDGQGPWEPCGWCEGTGKVTRWLRGMWLRYMREERRKRAS